jgi:hypothetical protein
MLNNLIGGLLGPNNQRQGPHGPMHFVQVHGNTAINIGDYAWGPSGLDAIITQVIAFKRKFCFFKIYFLFSAFKSIRNIWSSTSN